MALPVTPMLVLSLISLHKLLVIPPAHPNVLQVYMVYHITNNPFYETLDEKKWYLMDEAHIGNRTIYVGDLSTVKETEMFIFVQYKFVYSKRQLYSERYMYVWNQNRLREFFQTTTVCSVVLLMFVISSFIYLWLRHFPSRRLPRGEKVIN